MGQGGNCGRPRVCSRLFTYIHTYIRVSTECPAFVAKSERTGGLHTPWRKRCPNKVWDESGVQFLDMYQDKGLLSFSAVPSFNARTMEIGKEETAFVTSSDIP